MRGHNSASGILYGHHPRMHKQKEPADDLLADLYFQRMISPNQELFIDQVINQFGYSGCHDWSVRSKKLPKQLTDLGTVVDSSRTEEFVVNLKAVIKATEKIGKRTWLPVLSNDADFQNYHDKMKMVEQLSSEKGNWYIHNCSTNCSTNSDSCNIVSEELIFLSKNGDFLGDIVL